MFRVEAIILQLYLGIFTAFKPSPLGAKMTMKQATQCLIKNPFSKLILPSAAIKDKVSKRKTYCPTDKIFYIL